MAVMFGARRLRRARRRRCAATPTAAASVTVTDGVQVLRSAADLSSECSQRANSCDVDGNGSVTVSDGVNVLRMAAGSAITENCPGGSDGTPTSPGHRRHGAVPHPRPQRGAEREYRHRPTRTRPADTQDCEDGGSRTTSQSAARSTVTFDACRVSQPGLGRFQFDGDDRGRISGSRPAPSHFELAGHRSRPQPSVTDFDGDDQGPGPHPAGRLRRRRRSARGPSSPRAVPCSSR